MGRLSFVLAITILIVVVAMNTAASAGRGEAVATPTPDTAEDTHQFLRSDAYDMSPSLGGAGGAPSDLAGSTGLQSAEAEVDPEALEDFRQDLLELVDSLEALYPYAEAYAQISGEEPPPLVNRALIQTLTYDQLKIVRDTFGEAYGPFKHDVKALKSLVTAEKSQGEKKGKSGTVHSDIAVNAASNPPSTSIRIIPAPTPVTTPPPGIVHEEVEDADSTNDDLEDLPDPGYPTSVGCPETRFPNWSTLTTLIATFVAKEVDDFAEAAGCEGTFFVVAAPFGGGSNLPGCLGWAVLKGITLAAEAVNEGLNFCIGAIDAAELEASRQNVQILHAELAMHDRNLTKRFNRTDKFLFHMRNVNLRSRIEANLASDEDDPIALFQLPNSTCIKGVKQLSGDAAKDPSTKFSSGRVASCGLLEVVSDTVKSAIDMTKNANVSANNADALFKAAVDHYDNQRWKVAYDRFRKAYREVIRP